MSKSSVIMLYPELLNKILAQLREKSEDIYLLSRMLLETGCTAHQLSKMTIAEMKRFIEKNKSNIPGELTELLNLHMNYLRDSDYFFSGHRSMNHNRPISKRSYESLIRQVGLNHNINNLGVKALSRSFFYNYLRENQYDFKSLKRMMAKRQRFIKNLDEFLEMCEISPEEYEEDQKRHMEPNIGVYMDRLDEAIITLQKKRDLLSTGNYRYQDITDTIRILDAV